MAMTLDELTSFFRSVGAPDPESWARSEHLEGIDQRARFIFLRQAWLQVVADGDTDWIDNNLANYRRDPRGPFSDESRAIERMLALGVSRLDISDVVRSTQVAFLFEMCYLLADPGALPEGAEDINWGLFRTDDDDNPVGPISGLFESVLETDPTGRQMQSRED